MKISLTLLLSLALVACASKQKFLQEAAMIEIYLSPLIDLYQSNKALQQSARLAHITDNDGNIYNTYWNVASDSHDSFDEHVEMCKQQLTKLALFPGEIQLSTVDMNQLKPVLYKPFVACILQAGYKLNYSEAFSPLYFHVGLHRTASLNGSYLPLDETLEVSRQRADLGNLYMDTQTCQQQLLAIKQPPQIEQRVRDAVHIKLDPFAQSMKQCLEQKRYSVSLLQKDATNRQRVLSSKETLSPNPLPEAATPLKLPQFRVN